jgi:hypothetical protein
MLNDRPIGKLTLAGSPGGQHALLDMQQVLDYLESLDSEIAQVAAGDGHTAGRFDTAAVTAAAG